MIKFIHTVNIEYSFVQEQLGLLGIPVASNGTSIVNGECIRVYQIDHSSEEQITLISLAIPCKIKNYPAVTHRGHEETV
jgi:hypothetical protein